MTFLETLRAIVGTDHVLTHQLDGYEMDWRGLYRGRALAVALPGSTDQVCAVVAACSAARVAIVPQGGNTGLVGGAVPDQSGRQVLLNLRRMNRVRDLDEKNLTLTVEAGCVLEAVQERAAAAGLLFPLSLAAEGSCTIGGNLASNAGGTQVLRYGNARELCLGLEVVTPDGRVWSGLSGLRKDNSGYDLRQLYIGSEGTLGVITAATLRLFPPPASTMTAWISVPCAGAAIELLSLAQKQLGPTLTGFEIMGREAVALADKHFPQLRAPDAQAYPWHVVLEQSSHLLEATERPQFETMLEAGFERALIADAIVAESAEQAKRLWHVREAIPLAQAKEGANLKHDVSVPISRIPEFLEAVEGALRAALPDIRLVLLGHVGDGNLHYNVQAPEGDTGGAYFARHGDWITRQVYDAVDACGGSFSAEHGVGAFKTDELAHRKDAVALDLMQRIKAALDPLHLMNPGRVLKAVPVDVG
ncbi:FAD-binding oxidoreductase [Cupriavidus necator]